VKPEVFEQWAALMKDRKRGPARQLIEKAALEQSNSKLAAEASPSVMTVAGK
jgi:hypothetical protein